MQILPQACIDSVLALGRWSLPSGLKTVAVKGRLVLSSCLQNTADVSHVFMLVQPQQQVTAAVAIAVNKEAHLPTSLPKLPSSSASRAITLPSWSYIVYLFACSKPKMTVPHSTLRAITNAGCPTTSCTWAAAETMVSIQTLLHLYR